MPEAMSESKFHHDHTNPDGTEWEPTQADAILDFPTAWEIQKSVGTTLTHDPRCSSVPGWSALSGPAFLCDCGAIVSEFHRRLQEKLAE